nr:tyrosine-protein phosphatase [Quercus suber]
MTEQPSTQAADSSLPPFEKILNFRDLASINTESGAPTTTSPRITPGLLFRSARPDAATPSDRQQLTATYKIRTIIDLRTPTEHLAARQKFTSTPTPTAPAVAPADPKFPMRIPGIAYQDVNFNGASFSSALVKQLPWRQAAKLFGLYALGYRTQAIAVLGSQVMARRGLAGLAADSLEHCGSEVRSVFAALADADSYPVLVHCTQGKDRTGLVMLLVLMLLGVRDDDIATDYMRSEQELEPEREEKLVEIRSIGLPDEFADCPEDWVAGVYAWINERFGGVEGGLALVGQDCIHVSPSGARCRVAILSNDFGNQAMEQRRNDISSIQRIAGKRFTIDPCWEVHLSVTL